MSVYYVQSVVSDIWYKQHYMVNEISALCLSPRSGISPHSTGSGWYYALGLRHGLRSHLSCNILYIYIYISPHCGRDKANPPECPWFAIHEKACLVVDVHVIMDSRMGFPCPFRNVVIDYFSPTPLIYMKMPNYNVVSVVLSTTSRHCCLW